MRRRTFLTLGLVAIVAMGAANSTPSWVATADLDVSVDISPRGPIEACVGEAQRIVVGVQVDAVSLLGFRRFHLNARAADLGISTDGVSHGTPHTTYMVVPVKFDDAGRHTVQVDPSNLDWGQGAGHVSYSGATLVVNVIECHFVVDTIGVIQMADGGFSPTLNGAIQSAKLNWNKVNKEYEGHASQLNAATAVPRAGCVNTFVVDPNGVFLRGKPSSDGLSFHLDINWDKGIARSDAQGVQCPGIGGGRSNTFTLRPYSRDLPAGGVSAANQQAETWIIDTDGRTYSGVIYVTATRVHGP